MEQNIMLAIILAVIASFGFAGGAAVQHLAVGQAVDKREQETMGFAALWQLIRTPRWIVGLLILGVAAGLHIAALIFGPVTVVQPVGILAVPWSIIIAAKLHKHKVPGKVWLWVTVTIVALAAFTVLSSLYTKANVEEHKLGLIIAIIVSGLLAAGLGIAGHMGPRARRCLAWATGGAVLYGLASSLIRVVADSLFGGDWMRDPMFWTSLLVLVACYAIGGWMIQQGYANGPAETVVGSMTTIDPVVAVLIGLVVLGEGVGVTPLVATGMAVLGVAAVLGVVLLSHDHPDAVEQRAHLAALEATDADDAEATGFEARAESGDSTRAAERD
jgi:drug/metabolite transporter (DMT)-like permease